MKWTIEAINERLKAGKVGVKVEARGDRISLRATLPPKPGTGKSSPYQQYIALGVYNNPAGLQRAEAEAKIVGGLLARGEFDWGRYLEVVEQKQSCGDWVEKFRREYFAANGGDPTKLQTWKQHYESCFNRLPLDENLTPEILIAVAVSTPANTWTRRTVCQKFEQLAKFAGVKVDLKKYQGEYSSAKQIIRQLPSDAEIREMRGAISHPEWQWVFGAIACFGLRPHEAFFCQVDLTYPHSCRIDDGKTGARIAYPLPLEWAIDWMLWENKKPSRITVEGATFKDLGNKVYKAFKRYGVSCPTYNLRHAWAVRAATKYSVPTAVAAQWMGHSPVVHLREYQRHITQNDHLEVFERFAHSIE